MCALSPSKPLTARLLWATLHTAPPPAFTSFTLPSYSTFVNLHLGMDGVVNGDLEDPKCCQESGLSLATINNQRKPLIYTY